MDRYQFPSKYIENTVDEFSKLPGVGKRTALRLVLHLLHNDKMQTEALGKSILDLLENIKHCQICNNLSDNDICQICADSRRDQALVCVVESMKEVMAFENTHQFHGRYHVLGGLISPMDGIGPADLKLENLENAAAGNSIREVILALSTTMEGDTTNYYIYKKLKPYNLKITTLARGVSIGDEIEYTDEITLGRSLVNRQLFESTLNP